MVAAALAAEAVRRAARLFSVGAGYKAKTLCSAIFVGGRAIDGKSDEVSAEAYWPMRLFRARIDRSRGAVSASLLGFFPRTAYLRPGYGAALAPRAPAALPPPQFTNRPRRKEAASADARLDGVVARAFAEPATGSRVRTRAVLISQAGRLIAEKYAADFNESTLFPGWSMTKSAFGTLFGSLVAAKKIAIGDSGLLREWTTPNDARAKISAEDLLRMRSGLKFSEKYAQTGSDVNRMLFCEYDTAAYAVRRPSERAPGSRWQYMSGSSNILSLIARRLLGDNEYRSWPHRELFGPLGAETAVFELDAAGTFVASSHLFMRARDWLSLGELMLGRGALNEERIFGPEWIDFLTSATPQSPNAAYGAHWWLKLSPELGGQTEFARAVPAGSFHALGHEGQCLSVIPSRNLVILRLGLSIDIRAWNHARFLSEILAAVPEAVS